MIIFKCDKKQYTQSFLLHYLGVILPGAISKEFSNKGIPNYIEASIKQQFGKDITYLQLFRAIIDNLNITSSNDEFVIKLNERVKIKNIKLTDILNFLDFGNMSVRRVEILKYIREYSNKNLYRYNNFRPYFTGII